MLQLNLCINLIVLRKWTNYLKNYILSKFNQDQSDHQNSSTTIKEVEFVIKNPPMWASRSPDGFTRNLYVEKRCQVSKITSRK
jgi:hypothetical protein